MVFWLWGLRDADNRGVGERMEREADEIFCGKGVKRREVLHAGRAWPL